MTNFTDQMSRRSVAKGVVWAVPAVSVAAAAPAMAASPTAGLITGITGFGVVTSDAKSACPSQFSGSVTPSGNNPSPIVYVDTSVALGAATGQTASITISLYSVLDTSGTSAANGLGFVPGTYSMSDGTGGTVTATSSCLATNASGACTSITLTWPLSGVGTTANNAQRVPFRVGMVSGTTVPAGKQVSTGFQGSTFGGGPSGTSSGQVATFNGGTYTGAATC